MEVETAPKNWYPELPIAEDPIAEDFGSVHWTSLVATFSQTGAEVPRAKTPVSVNAATEFNTLGGRAGILHGKTLSVAAVVGLRLCARATQQVIIWTDCMFVINGFARGRRRKHLSHADLWKEFWEAHDAIGPPVLVHKVWRSHVTESEIAAPLEAHGNEVADKLAAREPWGTPSPWNSYLPFDRPIPVSSLSKPDLLKSICCTSRTSPDLTPLMQWLF